MTINELINEPINEHSQLSRHDFQRWGCEVLAIEQAALKQLYQYVMQDNFTQVCELIYRCRGKVVVMGVGKSGHIGRKIAATLASTGTPAFFVHPNEASHGDLGMVSPNDVVLAISNSGEAPELLTLIGGFRRLQSMLIAITGHPDSTLAKTAAIHLCIGKPNEACPLGLAPTSSTTATLVMGDALAVALLRARGFTHEDFARSHPGGRLGRRLLLQVKDIMRCGEAIPHVGLQASLRDALLVMTRHGLGMTAICDEQQRVKGIFTDGDLRRALDLKLDINHTPIHERMTVGGICIAAHCLAVDALNVMQEDNITVLLITQDEKLIGVIHLHDLLKAGVV